MFGVARIILSLDKFRWTMTTAYVFNPDHDLALASDSDHFDAPASARRFAHDCSVLPIWYASSEGVILSESTSMAWLNEMLERFPQLKCFSCTSSFKGIDRIEPWGWNKTIRRQAELQGVKNLPSLENLNELRVLQHRQLSIDATKKMSVLANDNLRIVKPALLLTKDEIPDFVAKQPYAIFKAPWSGSGKGIVRSLNGLSENLLHRVQNIAEKQGGVLAEPLYDVIQNFAMEFVCSQGKVDFAGYSWFFTNEHGAYTGNLLASDEHIETLLSQWINKQDLYAVRASLLEFISENIASKYDGFVGVDMFVFCQNDEIFLHPCVEFNLRMTMGLVARRFYDNFVEKGRTGRFTVDFAKATNMLFQDCENRKNEKPLDVNQGKIHSGYLSLTNPSVDSLYAVNVEIIEIVPLQGPALDRN